MITKIYQVRWGDVNVAELVKETPKGYKVRIRTRAWPEGRVEFWHGEHGAPNARAVRTECDSDVQWSVMATPDRELAYRVAKKYLENKIEYLSNELLQYRANLAKVTKEHESCD